MRSFDAAGSPLDVALRRRVGQHEPARGIGPVGGDDGVGIDHVLLRFRHRLDRPDSDRLAGLGVNRLAVPAAHFLGQHPFAVGVLVGLVRDHALGEQAAERLVDGDMAASVHGAREEARIEEMQNRMLDAADILVDGQPVSDSIGVGRLARLG